MARQPLRDIARDSGSGRKMVNYDHVSGHLTRLLAISRNWNGCRVRRLDSPELDDGEAVRAAPRAALHINVATTFEFRPSAGKSPFVAAPRQTGHR
jgi:hypothetical protein